MAPRGSGQMVLGSGCCGVAILSPRTAAQTARSGEPNQGVEVLAPAALGKVPEQKLNPASQRDSTAMLSQSNSTATLSRQDSTATLKEEPKLEAGCLMNEAVRFAAQVAKAPPLPPPSSRPSSAPSGGGARPSARSHAAGGAAAGACSSRSGSFSSGGLSGSIAEHLARLQSLCAAEGRQVAQQSDEIRKLRDENGRLRGLLDRVGQESPLPAPWRTKLIKDAAAVGASPLRLCHEGPQSLAGCGAERNSVMAGNLRRGPRTARGKRVSIDDASSTSSSVTVAGAVSEEKRLSSAMAVADSTPLADAPALQSEHVVRASNISNMSNSKSGELSCSRPPSMLSHSSVNPMTTKNGTRVQAIFRWRNIVVGTLRPVDSFNLSEVWQGRASQGSILASQSFERNRSSCISGVSLATSSAEVPAMSAAETRLRRYIISPDTRFRFAWVMAGLTFVAYDVLMTPLYVFFDMSTSPFQDFMWWCTILYWTADIAITLLTGIYINGAVNMRPAVIFQRYLRTWLAFDTFLVLLEWVQILTYLLDADVGGLPLSRTLRALRLLRILRMSKVGLLVSDLLSMSSQVVVHYLGFVKLVCILVVGIHLSACLWYGVGNTKGGWAKQLDKEDVSLFSQYLSAVSWTLSCVDGTAAVRSSAGRASELEQAVSIVGALVGISFYTLVLAKAMKVALEVWDKKAQQIQQTCCRYLRDQNISSELAARTRGYVSAFYKQSLRREHMQQELDLVGRLPDSLQVDLHEEARQHTLIVPLCADISRIKRSVWRELTHKAMHDVFKQVNEIVFNTQTACSRARFLDTGALRFMLDVDKAGPLSGAGAQGCLHNIAGKLKTVARGEIISEAALWTKWLHRGELHATKNSRLVELDAVAFGRIIEGNKDLYTYAVRYARKFVWYLNQNYASVLDVVKHNVRLLGKPTEFELQMEAQADHHYMFLSHYKVEAGTEAALMQEAFKGMIEKDPYHHANHLKVPVFLDSENLTDLTFLKEHVRKSHNLVLLLTPNLFTRPWCLVEIITCLQSGNNIVPVEVQRPGMKFQYPDEQFYANLRNGKGLSEQDIRLLNDQGIQLSDLEGAIKKIFEQIAQPFSPHKSANIRQAELWAILSRCDKHAATFHKEVSVMPEDEDVPDVAKMTDAEASAYLRSRTSRMSGRMSRVVQAYGAVLSGEGSRENCVTGEASKDSRDTSVDGKQAAG